MLEFLVGNYLKLKLIIIVFILYDLTQVNIE